MRVFVVLLALASIVPAALADELGKILKAHQARGAIVIERMSDGKRWVHDEKRAAKRFIPASTFKIPNTIFALETGAVANVDEIIPSDGKVWRIKEWNKAQSLRDAFKHSALPIYQEVARRIGLARMTELVAKAGYGNEEVGTAVDTFWLKGPLRISPDEQISFLKRLHGRQLPFSRGAQDATIGIMEVLRHNGRILRAKTGWEIASSPAIGWYVGWLEARDDVFFFAVDIDMTKKSHRRGRSQIAIDALGWATGKPLR